MGKKGKKTVQAAKRPAAAARDESDDESPADAIHVRIDFPADLRLILSSHEHNGRAQESECFFS